MLGKLTNLVIFCLILTSAAKFTPHDEYAAHHGHRDQVISKLRIFPRQSSLDTSSSTTTSIPTSASSISSSSDSGLLSDGPSSLPNIQSTSVETGASSMPSSSGTSHRCGAHHHHHNSSMSGNGTDLGSSSLLPLSTLSSTSGAISPTTSAEDSDVSSTLPESSTLGTSESGVVSSSSLSSVPGSSSVSVPSTGVSSVSSSDVLPSSISSTQASETTSSSIPDGESTTLSSGSSGAPSTTTTSASGSQPTWLTGTQSGHGTHYEVGQGACGVVNNDNQDVAAVSWLLFDVYPGFVNGTNPNNNPVCGKSVTVSYQPASGQVKTVPVTIMDRCTGCGVTDLDLSPIAFSALADQSLGNISITWVWNS